MAWRGSFSRSLMSTAFRSSAPRSAAAPRLRPPSMSASRSRRFSFSNPSTLGQLGCTQSLLPLHGGATMTSHFAVNVRAFCELSHGTFCRSCPDR